MFKLALLAAVFAFAQGSVVLPAGYAAGYAGLGLHGYAGLGLNGYGLAAPLAAHAPAVATVAHAAPLAYAAAPAIAHAAPVATNYALPPTRVIEEAPIVEQVVEPVEQHGYSIRY